MQFLLAQVNVLRLLAPLDSERLRPFVGQLERVNAAADAAPGFVWRLQTDDGDATAVRVFDDAKRSFPPPGGDSLPGDDDRELGPAP